MSIPTLQTHDGDHPPEYNRISGNRCALATVVFAAKAPPAQCPSPPRQNCMLL